MPRYSRVLLEHATDPRNGGLLAAANASGRASLADRGPELRLHLVVEHETVVRASFQTAIGVSPPKYVLVR